MSYYEGDAWTYHEPVWTKCAECLEYFDQQEKEGGNVCQPCLDKCYGEGENKCVCTDQPPYQECLEHSGY